MKFSIYYGESKTAVLGRLVRAGAVVAVLALFAGCATGPTANPADPLEPFNRGVTRFNDNVDRAVARPVAKAYQNVVPQIVRTGVSNFFNNLADVWNFVNSVLQLRAEESAQTFMRVNVNTIFGLGGLLDVASDLGIQRRPNDFGMTLARWGMPPGPYLVLPLLGPSTVRDAAGLPVDYMGGLVSEVNNIPVRNSLYALRLVDKRAGLFQAEGMLDKMAMDKYSFTRDVFLQFRLNAVYDGNPPDTESKDTPGD